MKLFTRFSIKNMLVIFLTIIMIIIGGIYSSGSLKMELMPNISFPLVSIFTVYPGAAPDDVAEGISKPIQKAIAGIQGIKTVNTTSNENVSLVMVTFDYSKKMEKAQQEIQDAVNKIKLPEKAQKPSVSKLSYGSIPIVSYSITAEMPDEQLSQFINDKVSPELSGIKGVGSVSASGIYTKNIYIRIDEKKLKEKGVSAQDIQQALAANDINYPIGTVDIDGSTIPLKVTKKINSLNDIKSIPIIIRSNTGINTVFLSDVATVVIDKPEGSSYTRNNLKSTVILTVYKNDDANSVQVAKDTKTTLEDISKSNPGVIIKKLGDSASYITKSIDSMVREGLLGAIFAILIIAFFLRDLRATIIAIISIPLSIMITLIMMPRLGISLNIMSLSGMAVAVGRIVDDSIVVIENIYRRLQRRKDEGEEIIESASGEVSSAITSSTLTTVAVFLPLAFVEGMVGKIFGAFAWTVVICILSSLLVAVTVVPLMSKLMLLKKAPKLKKETSAFEAGYKSILNFSLNHRLFVVIIAVFLIAGSLFGVSRVGFQFLPADKTNMINAQLRLPAGTSAEITNKEALKMEEAFVGKPDVDMVTSLVGDNSGDGNSYSMQSSNQAIIMIIVKDGKDPAKILEAVKQKAKTLSNNTVNWNVAMQDNMSGGARLEVVVNGKNVEDIKAASELIATKIKIMPELSNISNNLSASKPEIAIKVDSEKAAKNGLRPDYVVGLVSSQLNYNKLNTVQNNGKTYDVYLGLDKKGLSSIEAVKNIELIGMAGIVKVKDIAEVVMQNGPVSVLERNGKTFAAVTADISAKDTTKVSTDSIKLIDSIKSQFKPGVTYSVGGSSDDINDTFKQMGIAMLIAIFLVFITMVLTFKEGTAPLAILFSLPFAAVGALLALLITNHPLTMSGLVGILMLIGIVVTNAIVLVDRVQSNRKKGMEIREALLEAGGVRLRPIIMTATATIMALIPMALGFSEGAIISEELGIVVIGGLTMSTVLTLIVVPVAYSLFEGLKLRILGTHREKEHKEKETILIPKVQYE